MWPQKRQQDSFLTLTHVICNFRDFLSCWIHFCNLGFRSQKWTPWPPLQHVIWRPQVSLFTQLESIALYSFQEVGVTLLASGGLLIDVRNGFNTYKNTYRMAVFISTLTFWDRLCHFWGLPWSICGRGVKEDTQPPTPCCTNSSVPLWNFLLIFHWFLVDFWQYYLTFLWPLMSFCWLVGLSVGLSVIIWHFC